jgi:hypothetical protein
MRSHEKLERKARKLYSMSEFSSPTTTTHNYLRVLIKVIVGVAYIPCFLNEGTPQYRKATFLQY